ncbi:perlucin-like [Mytilus californianus]|uniref:perlucin-like n=1 Tax=Mytilus californianus TaxID=6549 RepID=UPI002247B910|nr:perlucin-like [Mytilus californianus]
MMHQMQFVCLLFTFVRAIYGQHKEHCLNKNDESLITSMKQMMQALTEKMQILENKLKRLRLKSMWIGANDRSREGRWLWESDRSSLAFSDWYPRQPDDGSRSEDCAHLYSGFSYRWNDDQCWNRAGYICERD